MTLKTTLQELSFALTKLDSAICIGSQLATTATPVRASASVRHTTSQQTPEGQADHLRTGGDKHGENSLIEDRDTQQRCFDEDKHPQPFVGSAARSGAAIKNEPVPEQVPLPAAKVLHFAPLRATGAKKSDFLNTSACISVETHASSLHSTKIVFHSPALNIVSQQTEEAGRSVSAATSAPSKGSDATAQRLLHATTLSSAAKARGAPAATGLRSAELLQRIKEELARGKDIVTSTASPTIPEIVSTEIIHTLPIAPVTMELSQSPAPTVPAAQAAAGPRSIPQAPPKKVKVKTAVNLPKRYPQNDIFSRLYEKGTENHPAPKDAVSKKESSNGIQQKWQGILRNKPRLPLATSSTNPQTTIKASTDIWKRLYKQSLNKPITSTTAANTHPDGECEARNVQKKPSINGSVAAPQTKAATCTSAVVQRLLDRERGRQAQLEEMRHRKEEEEAEQLRREREEILNKVRKLRELHKSKYYDINNHHQRGDPTGTASIVAPAATNTSSQAGYTSVGDVRRKLSTGSQSFHGRAAPTGGPSAVASLLNEPMNVEPKNFALTPSGIWQKNSAMVDIPEHSGSKRLHSRTSSYVTPVPVSDCEEIQPTHANVPQLDFSKLRR
jgi:hypothetical protein